MNDETTSRKSFEIRASSFRAVTDRDATAEIASLLRKVHADGTNADLDDLQWLAAVLPLSRPVRRRLVASLIDAGHDDEAEHLLTRCLLIWPGDAQFIRLLVQCQMRQDRFDAAQRELDRLLTADPRDRRNLLLAADLAMAQGDPRTAISHLLVLNLRFPRQPAIEHRMIQAQLAAGRIASATWFLRLCQTAPPELHARVFAARNRHRDALELLDPDVCRDRPACRKLRLTLLSRCASTDVIRRAIDEAADDEHAEVAVEAATIALELGDFERSASIARGRCDVPAVRRDALAVLAVAEAFAQHYGHGIDDSGWAEGAVASTSDAIDALERRPKSHPLKLQKQMASLWLRAKRGEVFRRQLDPAQAAADPEESILKSLLVDAVSRLNRAIRNPEDVPEWLDDTERARLAEVRDVGRVLLGMPVTAPSPGHLTTLSGAHGASSRSAA